MAADTNITAQIKPDKCCPNSVRKNKEYMIMDSINFIERICYPDSTKCNQQNMAIKVLYSSSTLYIEAKLQLVINHTEVTYQPQQILLFSEFSIPYDKCREEF